MKTAKALREERAQKFQEFQGLVALGENATPEQEQRANALSDEIEKLNGEIATAEKREKVAAEATAHGAGGNGGNKFTPSDERNLQRFSISKALSEKRYGKLTGVEAEVEQAYKEERQARGVKEDGGMYIPADFIRWSKPTAEERSAFTIGTEGGDVMQTTLGNVIPFLQPKPIVQQLGATVVEGLSGDFQLPRFTNNTTISAYAETSSITDTTITTDNKKLSPKRYGGEIQWTIQANIQASFALENTLRQMINRALEVKVDSEALQGSGSSNRVTGLINYSGIGATALGTNGAAPTWAKTLEFLTDLLIGNSNMANVQWLATPAAMAKLMNTAKQSSGVEGNFILRDDVMKALLGYPFNVTNQLPSNLTKGTGSSLSACVLGDWSEMWLGFFGGVNLVFDDLTLRRAGTQALIIEQFFDVQVAQEAAFSVCVDMVTT